MKRITLISSVFTFLVLASCNSRDDYKFVPDEVEGYRPIYFDTSQNLTAMIYSSAPKAVQVAGKIYLFKHYLFVGEPDKGVHVFDNSDPVNPIPVAFIHIPHNYDIAVKDSVLFADTYVGLVLININHLPQIKVISYLRNNNSLWPPLPRNPNNGMLGAGNSRNYFECVDFNKGPLVGWELVRLKKPKCYE